MFSPRKKQEEEALENLGRDCEDYEKGMRGGQEVCARSSVLHISGDCAWRFQGYIGIRCTQQDHRMDTTKIDGIRINYLGTFCTGCKWDNEEVKEEVKEKE